MASNDEISPRSKRQKASSTIIPEKSSFNAGNAGVKIRAPDTDTNNRSQQKDAVFQIAEFATTDLDLPFSQIHNINQDRRETSYFPATAEDP